MRFTFNPCLLGSEEGVKEKLVPLIQGPSDTKELHTSRWLNEIRKPESLLAPDLLAFSVQVPQQGEDCRNSGKRSAIQSQREVCFRCGKTGLSRDPIVD